MVPTRRTARHGPARQPQPLSAFVKGGPLPERMHAVVQHAFGGPEVLEVAEVDRPVPLGTEVLVRVEAAGVNPVEPLIRSGRFPLIGRPPFILGWDISRVIEGLEGGHPVEVRGEAYGV